MYASAGDRIVVRGHRVGEPVRDCKIIEVQGSEGEPPYLVRWEDSEHDTLFYPGSDATIEHYQHQTK
jgi:hypothetical protein